MRNHAACLSRNTQQACREVQRQSVDGSFSNRAYSNSNAPRRLGDALTLGIHALVDSHGCPRRFLSLRYLTGD